MSIEILPAHILVEIFCKFESLKEIAAFSSVCRSWRSAVLSPNLWQAVRFEEKERINLRQLTAFVNSPYSKYTFDLSIEGYVIRRFDNGSQSIITNHVLTLMNRKMAKLKSFRLWNTNIQLLNIKNFPKSLETLSLEGCIIECNFLSDLCRRDVLPKLKNLDLNYVHNLSSYSQSFEAILNKKGIENLQLRHCYKIQNKELSKLSQIYSLRILNLSEIASLNDTVLKCLVRLIRLSELYVAFTVVSDIGIKSVCEMKYLQLLDIRGCPKITAVSLHKLDIAGLREVWISGRMEGAKEARKVIDRMKILDEVDLKKMAITLEMSNYSVHFADVLKEKPEEGNVIEDGNFIVQLVR